MTLPPLFVDGKPIRVGNRVGKGGEGEVFLLTDDSKQALKFYTIPDLQAREAKVTAMLRLKLAERYGLVAFPAAVARDRFGKFRGFLMRFAREHKPLFELYAPGARKQTFPQASYRFLVRTAANTARSVAAVHDAGCVIGDINHSGFLISQNATVALIDADSFQLTDGFETHRCLVGVPEYTPPELLGQSLTKVIRTVDHDGFGLAVAIFQLLAMGRHPYVGAYSKGEMPLPRAIAEHRFAYSLKRSVGMTPPPGASTLKDFTPQLASAFEAAFTAPSGRPRPSALQWVSLLEDFEKSLQVCKSNGLHHYSTSAAECPWCRMEHRLGIVLFVPTAADFANTPVTSIGTNASDIERLWAQVISIKAPTPSDLNPKLPTASLSPSPAAREASRRGYLPAAKKIAGVIAGLGIIALNPALWFVAAGAVWAGFAGSKVGQDHSAGYRQRYLLADQEYQQALLNWETRCGYARINQVKSTLDVAKAKFDALRAEEAERIAKYQAGREAHQRRMFLDRFRIRDYKIKGVGRSKLATLASYGVDTAADATQDRILSVPGFGPINSQPLLAWHRQLASKFVYDVTPNDTDRLELSKIRNEISQQAQALRSLLVQGARDYAQAVEACRRMIANPDSLLVSLYGKRSQLAADIQFLGLPIPSGIYRYTPPTANTSQSKTATYRPPAAAGPPSSSRQAPPCPRCGRTMVRRTAHRGRNAGNAFWGCVRFPFCKGTRPL